MFRNSIKEAGEPPLEAVSLSRRDSLTRLHDAIKSAAHDGRVRLVVKSRRENSIFFLLFFSFFIQKHEKFFLSISNLSIIMDYVIDYLIVY